VAFIEALEHVGRPRRCGCGHRSQLGLLANHGFEVVDTSTIVLGRGVIGSPVAGERMLLLASINMRASV